MTAPSGTQSEQNGGRIGLFYRRPD
ncbi:uncharacterized protein METZ01_LOCUS343400, partial [marine metagenome]